MTGVGSLSLLQSRLRDMDGLLALMGLAEELDREGGMFALLESGEPGAPHAEKSLLYCDPVLTITLKENKWLLKGHTPVGRRLCLQLDKVIVSDHRRLQGPSETQQQLRSETLFQPLRQLLSSFSGEAEVLVEAALVGYTGFELFHAFEGLELPDTNGTDDVSLTLFQTCIRWDHASASGWLTVLAIDEQPQRNSKRPPAHIDASLLMDKRLSQMGSFVAGKSLPSAVCDATMSSQDGFAGVMAEPSDQVFADWVAYAKKMIAAGECFQVVLSRDFRCPCPKPWLAYRRLCRQNPSPYQFYMRLPEQVIFGASPERFLRVYRTDDNRLRAQLYPIAGTRPRGLLPCGLLDKELDARLEASLRLDSKEVAEHMMLVDLARNDLARIGVPGTRVVKRLLDIDKYSRVMHLVSEVEVDVRSDLDAFHAYCAVMNMGTLTGAPKVRATQILCELEKRCRGVYGGAIGYWNFLGEVDTAIAIRSAVVKQNEAVVTAGAGVVAQSDPQREAQETWDKAAAVLTAIKESTHAR